MPEGSSVDTFFGETGEKMATFSLFFFSFRSPLDFDPPSSGPVVPATGQPMLDTVGIILLTFVQ